MNSPALLEKPLSSVDYLANLDRKITPLRDELLNHRLYNLLTDASSLRIFLEYHIYGKKFSDLKITVKQFNYRAIGLTVRTLINFTNPSGLL